LQWLSLCNHLPSAAVHDMLVRPRERELVIGTRGRSTFVLNVQPIQEQQAQSSSPNP
jgi:hypothetical protein